MVATLLSVVGTKSFWQVIMANPFVYWFNKVSWKFIDIGPIAFEYQKRPGPKEYYHHNPSKVYMSASIIKLFKPKQMKPKIKIHFSKNRLCLSLTKGVITTKLPSFKF